jgi:hypothetical protein
MPSLDKRLTKLEDAFMQHLTESGEIRGDLKWLKKAFWTLAGLGVTLTGGMAAELVRHIWR